MLHVDVPTRPEIEALVAARADACVSIYLPTTPLTQAAQADRIALRDMAKDVDDRLEALNVTKKRREEIAAALDDLAADDAFWAHQARSLAVLVTADGLRTFRLASRLTPRLAVSDRFHLKPLYRALALPHAAIVLALAENGVRVLEVTAEAPPREIAIPGLPRDARAATHRADVNAGGLESQKPLLRAYARAVDAALRPLLTGRDTPLVLAAAEPLASIYRSVSSYPALAAKGVAGSPLELGDDALAKAARAVIDDVHAHRLEMIRTLYDVRAGDGRATADIATAARAAVLGAIDQLLVDIDVALPGSLDEITGAVRFVDADAPGAHDVIDEIAGRALLTGARVFGVRRADLPGRAPLAAILRYPV